MLIKQTFSVTPLTCTSYKYLECFQDNILLCSLTGMQTSHIAEFSVWMYYFPKGEAQRLRLVEHVFINFYCWLDALFSVLWWHNLKDLFLLPVAELIWYSQIKSSCARSAGATWAYGTLSVLYFHVLVLFCFCFTSLYSRFWVISSWMI